MKEDKIVRLVRYNLSSTTYDCAVKIKNKLMSEICSIECLKKSELKSITLFKMKQKISLNAKEGKMG